MTSVQLRRYEIKPGEMEPFLEAVRTAFPVREQYGFGVEFALGKRAQAASEDTLARGIAGGGVVVLVYFDDPRSYAPRNAEADKMAPSTAEDRVKLLRGLPATLVAHERNGWVYRLTSSSDQGGVAPTR